MKGEVPSILGNERPISPHNLSSMCRYPSPITALVHPLCVIPDGGDLTSYMIILPKRNWNRYFGDRVLSEFNKSFKK